MIHNYNEFILESQITQLILEANITCSGSFLNKISQFKKKNAVASLLYDLFTREPYIEDDLKQNYLDITDKEEYVTFLSDKKAEDVEDDQYYTAKARTEMKVGRLARAILTNKDIQSEMTHSFADALKKLTDKDFEDFVNLYKASKVIEDQKFELVAGKKIRKYYDGDMYAHGNRGTLGSSCMRGDECQDYFDIYTENPEVCSLLVYLDSKGYVLGRAIVWKLSHSPCEAKYFMDRIYCSNDSDMIKFMNYADEQGWCYKYKQSNEYMSQLLFKYRGKKIIGEATVELKKADFSEYPYLDTLYCLNRKKKYISNVSFVGVENLQDTGGECNGCFDCEGKGYEEYACNECDGLGEMDDEKCESCEGTGAALCPGCSGSYKIAFTEIIEGESLHSDLESQAIKELARIQKKTPSLKKLTKKKK